MVIDEQAEDRQTLLFLYPGAVELAEVPGSNHSDTCCDILGIGMAFRIGEGADLFRQIMYQRLDFLPYADNSSRITCRRVSSSDSLFEFMYSLRAILMSV